MAGSLCMIHVCGVRMWFWDLSFALIVGIDKVLYRAYSKTASVPLYFLLNVFAFFLPHKGMLKAAVFDNCSCKHEVPETIVDNILSLS